MKILGLPILIEWPKFAPGTSFFIPCIDRKVVSKWVNQEAKRLRIEVVCKPVIENGIYGLRVWRTDAIVETHSPELKAP